VSLVGKQRGDTRRVWSMQIAGVLASLALAGPALQPAPLAEVRGGPASSVTQLQKDALPPDEKQKQSTPARIRDRNRDQDNRKARRRALCELFGFPTDSGRQWEFLRRQLSRQAPDLLRLPAQQIKRLAFVRAA
jgi:hypothetical protein